MKKKFGLVIVILFALSTGFIANKFQAMASPPVEAPAGHQETVQVFLPLLLRPLTGNYTLTIWHDLAPQVLLEYQKVLDYYHQVHPNINFVIIHPDDMLAALQTAVPAGVGPDVILWANDHIGELEDQNLIIPIGYLLPNQYIQDNFEPAAVAGVTYQNQIWAIPDTQEGIALVYNKSLISESDLPNPNDFNDLKLKAINSQNANPGKKYLCNQGLGGEDAYHVAPIFFGFGLKNYGGYVDENGIAYLDTGEALAAGEWIKSFQPYATFNGEYGVCEQGLINSQVAMWWTGPWALQTLKNAGLNYGIAPMGNPFVGIKTYLVTPNAISRGNEPALGGFLEYLGSASVQKRLTLANFTTPANTVALNDPDIQALYAIQKFGLSLHAGVPMGNSTYTTCQWGPVGQETLNIWNGTKTPVAALADAQAAIDACIASIP